VQLEIWEFIHSLYPYLQHNFDKNKARQVPC